MISNNETKNEDPVFTKLRHFLQNFQEIFFDENIKNNKKSSILCASRRTRLEDQISSITGNKLSKSFTLNMCINYWAQAILFEPTLSQFCAAIHYDDIFMIHFGVIQCRRVFVDAFHEHRQIPDFDVKFSSRLIELLDQKEYPRLQLEAAWTLVSITSGNHEQALTLVEQGVIPKFIRLLEVKSELIQEQVFFGLLNLAHDCVEFRDEILLLGGLSSIIRVAENITNRNLLKMIARTIRSVCRRGPLPRDDDARSAIPALCKIIKTQQDPEILIETLWALVYLICSEKTREAVILVEVIPTLVSLLKHETKRILIPSLRCLGSIAQGEEIDSKIFMQVPEFLHIFFNLLHHQSQNVRMEACWILTNLTVNNTENIESLLGTEGFLERLINLIEVNQELGVVYEAGYLVGNIIAKCQAESL